MDLLQVGRRRINLALITSMDHLAVALHSALTVFMLMNRRLVISGHHDYCLGGKEAVSASELISQTKLFVKLKQCILQEKPIVAHC